MRNFINILLLVILSINISAQNSFIITGYIINKKTNTPISGAHVIVKEKQKVSVSDKNGYYSIILYKENVELVFSHTQYENQNILIRKAKDQRIDIVMEEKINMLPEAVVGVRKPVNLVAKKLYDVTDYEFINNNLLLFAYRYKEKINPWLVIINNFGDTICTQHIDVEGTFYKDCTDNIHLITKQKAYQIHYDSTKIKLLYPVSPKEFKEALSPCIAEMNNKYYLKQYYYNNQVLTYYIGNPEDTTISELRIIADEVGLRMLADRDRFHAMGAKAPTEADLRFEEMCFFDPIFAPLVKIKDRICIFNYVDSLMEFYNEKGELINEITMNFHNKPHWKEELYVDNAMAKVYTLFKKNGVSTLYEINLNTGKLGKSIVIPSFIFVDKIKVNNNHIYFLYRKTDILDLMKLYKYKIE